MNNNFRPRTVVATALFTIATCALTLGFSAAGAQESGNGAQPAANAGETTAAVTGSGTTNYISKWTSATALGNSALYQTGGRVGLGDRKSTRLNSSHLGISYAV